MSLLKTAKFPRKTHYFAKNVCFFAVLSMSCISFCLIIAYSLPTPQPRAVLWSLIKDVVFFKIILRKVTTMKVDVLSAVILLFCLGVCVTLLDVGALVSLAEAAVESTAE
ncbi:hypothetical protein [Cellvibrio sp. OA-2007]